ncbi:hypothetical protein M5K25_011638 [Dendrobium thyrsiflorum]|uniref:Amino acid transporter transmembrane domain-containing protein n=1 Tax=Dendrobium thyrsiflorum TaxID=117978 RepID=A0ABD0V3R0_DENTH
MVNRRSSRIVGASRSNSHQSRNQSMNHRQPIYASFYPERQNVAGEGTSGPSLEERIRKMEESHNEILQLLRETRQPALQQREEVLLPRDPPGIEEVQPEHLQAEIHLPPPRRHPRSLQDNELADTASSTHPSQTDSLRFTSAISVLLAVVFVLISSGMAIYALFQGTIKKPRLLPDLHNQSFLELFTAIPVIVVAFTFQFNVHPIRSELSRVSDMKPAVRVSLLLCTVIYAVVGLAGYLLFGDDTMADVLSNFDKSSASPILDDVVRLSYALHLVLVFPLLFYSLRLNVDGLVFPKSQQRPLPIDAGRFLFLTAVLLGLVYLAAIAIPNVWTVFQFMGSTTAVGISLIFPGAVVLRDIYSISKRNDKLLAGIMISLALTTSCIAIYSNILSLFSGDVKRSRSN